MLIGSDARACTLLKGSARGKQTDSNLRPGEVGVQGCPLVYIAINSGSVVTSGQESSQASTWTSSLNHLRHSKGKWFHRINKFVSSHHFVLCLVELLLLSCYFLNFSFLLFITCPFALVIILYVNSIVADKLTYWLSYLS